MLLNASRLVNACQGSRACQTNPEYTIGWSQSFGERADQKFVFATRRITCRISGPRADRALLSGVWALSSSSSKSLDLNSSTKTTFSLRCARYREHSVRLKPRDRARLESISTWHIQTDILVFRISGGRYWLPRYSQFIDSHRPKAVKRHNCRFFLQPARRDSFAFSIVLNYQAFFLPFFWLA